MVKVLINKQCVKLAIRTEKLDGVYSNNIFYHSIIANEDKIGEELLMFQVENDKPWEHLNHHVRFHVENKIQKFLKEDIPEDMFGVKYRKLEQKDEINMKVEHLINCHSFAYVSLFITTKEQLEKLDGKELMNVLTQVKNFHQHGIVIRDQDGQERRLETDLLDWPRTFQLKYENNIVTWKVSDDGEKFHLVSSTEVEYREDLCVGISLSVPSVEWYPWIYTNCINLYLNQETNHLDYCMKIGDGKRDSLINQFLYMNYVNIRDLEKVGMDILDYLLCNVCYGRYISLQLCNENEKMLIYGYENEKELFDILYFDLNQGWKTGQITYKKVIQEMSEEIEIIAYKISKLPFEFNCNIVKENIHKHLLSKNVYESIQNILPQEEGVVYGISIYETLMQEPWRMKPEHIRLLQERNLNLNSFVNYLDHKKDINMQSSKYCNDCLSKYNQVIMSLLNSCSNNSSSLNLRKQSLIELQKYEEKFFQLLIQEFDRDGGIK